MNRPRLFAGRALTTGPETFVEHVARLGPLPSRGRELIDTLIHVGLTGRGGAAFPVGLKWRTAVARSRGLGIVVVNGAEGEPRSKKDSLLMATRPHLVIDGALLAAQALQAREIVLYVGEDHRAAWVAIERAVNERPEHERRQMRMVAAPARYVAGESSAALHLVAAGIALPTSTPAAPALVQNVETLGHVALIARFGQDTGTVLVTVAGGIAHPGVLELETSATVGGAITLAGGAVEPARAILLGGYFGAWLEVDHAWGLPLDPVALRERGMSLGCGVIGVQPQSRCPVCETSGILKYLARESSSQCGPCFFGLHALADACNRIAVSGTNADDLHGLERWSVEVRGRGACKHPDGAVMFLQSALKTFAPEFAHHSAHDSRRTA